MQRDPSSAARRLPAAIAAGVGALLLLSNPATAQTPPFSLGVAVGMKGSFAVEDTGNDTPRGLSGLACLRPSDGRRLCIAVNDEERFAEWVSLDGAMLAPTGQLVQLLSPGKKQKDAIVGTMPLHRCDDADSFGEFDGEAIATSENMVYVTGSNACSRKRGRFKPSAFVLARFAANGKAMAPSEVERSWRVADLILKSPLADSFARPGKDGTNIEGMAIIGDEIFFGFRTPNRGGMVTILHAPVEPLFAAGAAPSTVVPGTIQVKVADGAGIRDLAALPDGRLLVLTGPAMDEPAPYLLNLLDPKTRSFQVLAELRTPQSGQKDKETGQTAKAEAVAVLATQPECVAMLVAYDNIDDGGVRLHSIAMPKTASATGPCPGAKLPQ